MSEVATSTVTPLEIRADLEEAHVRAWDRIAAPGAWWTGPERVAIAVESRRARECQLGATRKAALSPYGNDDGHEANLGLSAPAVEAIHRLTTDPGRLKREWLETLLATAELSVEQYVELVGVLTQAVSMDFLRIGLGQPLDELPEPREGEPNRRRPTGAAMEEAWVPMVQKAKLDPEDADIYGPGGRCAT